MSVQSGRDLLLKIDLDGHGRFETFAGLRTTQLTFDAAAVDVTAMDSDGGWRELLAGGGVRSARIAGAGVFRDAATDARARALFFDGTVARYQVILPGFGVVEGPFQIASLEFSGGHDGEVSYSVALASAGALGFAPL